MEIQFKQPVSILTRTSGYLESVCSHSLQPFTGCALGGSLCGVGCYAQHQQFLTTGRAWGSFLDVKQNATELYLKSFVTLHPSEVDLGDFCKIDYYALHERLTRTNSCD